MMKLEDVERVRNRNPEVEVTRWVGGLSYGETRQWDWERPYDIKFPVPTSQIDLEVAWESGMLRKKDLIDGKYYWGFCRNARVVQWSVEKNMFFYMRLKGRWYKQAIKYPGEEKSHMVAGRLIGFEIFVPWIEVEPLDFERVAD